MSIWSRILRRRESVPVPRRIWRRGNKYNYMELWENPNGSRVWKITRLFRPMCPRCLHYNYSALEWTVPFEENVDPCSRTQVRPVSYQCTRCQDEQTFTPQIRPSEWYQYR